MPAINSLSMKSVIVFSKFFLCFVLFLINADSIKAQDNKDPWEQSPISISSRNLKNNNVDPTILIKIIKTEQNRYVKESYGEAANQCFTDIDLEVFKKSNVTNKIIKELRKDKQFIKAVSTLKNKSPDEQQKLLDEAMKTYKPTWAELGAINKNGQTDAGQKAERLIAGAVVNLINEILKK